MTIRRLIEEILRDDPSFGHMTTNDFLVHIIKELDAMALNLTALTAAVAKVSADVDSLIAAQGTAATQAAADQAAVDAVVPAVAAISAKVEAVLPPPPPATAAA